MTVFSVYLHPVIPFSQNIKLTIKFNQILPKWPINFFGYYMLYFLSLSQSSLPEFFTTSSFPFNSEKVLPTPGHPPSLRHQISIGLDVSSLLKANKAVLCYTCDRGLGPACVYSLIGGFIVSGVFPLGRVTLENRNHHRIRALESLYEEGQMKNEISQLFVNLCVT